ncbi:hypothetical protein [Paludibacterium paludis]|nr:hypothetical protein [Paludibacterium paludis]
MTGSQRYGADAVVLDLRRHRIGADHAALGVPDGARVQAEADR